MHCQILHSRCNDARIFRQFIGPGDWSCRLLRRVSARTLCLSLPAAAHHSPCLAFFATSLLLPCWNAQLHSGDVESARATSATMRRTPPDRVRSLGRTSEDLEFGLGHCPRGLHGRGAGEVLSLDPCNPSASLMSSF